MRESRQSGSEGGGAGSNRLSLPLSIIASLRDGNSHRREGTTKPMMTIGGFHRPNLPLRFRPTPLAARQQQPRQRLRERVQRTAIGQRDRQPRTAGGVFLDALAQAIADLRDEALGGRLGSVLGHQLAEEIEDGPQHLAAGRRHPLAALGQLLRLGHDLFLLAHVDRGLRMAPRSTSSRRRSSSTPVVRSTCVTSESRSSAAIARSRLAESVFKRPSSIVPSVTST